MIFDKNVKVLSSIFWHFCAAYCIRFGTSYFDNIKRLTITTDGFHLLYPIIHWTYEISSLITLTAITPMQLSFYMITDTVTWRSAWGIIIEAVQMEVTIHHFDMWPSRAAFFSSWSGFNNTRSRECEWRWGEKMGPR